MGHLDSAFADVPRHIDSARQAADALGEARLAAGAPELIAFAQRTSSKKLVSAQIAAIPALGRFSNDQARAVAGLVAIIEREPPPHSRAPRTNLPEHIERMERFARMDRFALVLAVTGASLDALAELRAEAAVGALLLAMYQLPELSTQIRRALVASGPGAVDGLRKILRLEHTAVEQLFRTQQLHQYCGEYGGAPCRPVSAKDYHAAIALGGPRRERGAGADRGAQAERAPGVLPRERARSGAAHRDRRHAPQDRRARGSGADARAVDRSQAGRGDAHGRDRRVSGHGPGRRRGRGARQARRGQSGRRRAAPCRLDRVRTARAQAARHRADAAAREAFPRRGGEAAQGGRS